MTTFESACARCCRSSWRGKSGLEKTRSTLSKECGSEHVRQEADRARAVYLGDVSECKEPGDGRRREAADPIPRQSIGLPHGGARARTRAARLERKPGVSRAQMGR